ncbi:RNA-binding cell elongation regulator Jag/EloR [Thalassorhabdus alkalitolerans]|uniref:RNA-binding protein KhpB n=1 Tax=Thalassorhabdus alkalitolerans TaxID=2282697 RepID=A0ABW0YMP3_9BACI
MRTIKVSGKTIEEALSQALNDLEAQRDEVEYEVLEEPQKGFLGFIGNKPALLKVQVKPQPKEEALSFLKQLLQDMEVKAEVEEKGEGKDIEFHLTGEDLGSLIGKRGKTLDAIQYLVNLVANRHSDQYLRLTVDAEGYRERRKQSLEHLASRLANKALKTRQKVTLEPMNARERKIIHHALQKSREIETFSEGKEPYRKVTILPKDHSGKR